MELLCRGRGGYDRREGAVCEVDGELWVLGGEGCHLE